MSSLSRFNPKAGITDFWSEFRKPNPLRWPILALSTLPLVVIGYWLSGEVHYVTPERPQITYITTFRPDRTEEEIIASNKANQEVKELREAAEARLAERKREIYKTLGAGIGMDVEEIEARADARRAAEEAELAKRREQALAKDSKEDAGAEASAPLAPETAPETASDTPSESPQR